MNDIRNLESWNDKTAEWNLKAGSLKMKAGVSLIDALESWYEKWNASHTDGNRRSYLQWRLRLHLKFNDDPEFLEELDSTFELGLHDEEPGPTFWHVPAEVSVGKRRPFNWRTDSGDALRGRRRTDRVEGDNEE